MASLSNNACNCFSFPGSLLARSCVRLKSGNVAESDPPEFNFKEFRHLQLAAETLQIIIEQRLQEVAIQGS